MAAVMNHVEKNGLVGDVDAAHTPKQTRNVSISRSIKSLRFLDKINCWIFASK